MTALFRQQIHMYTCTCVSLVRWHRWSVGRLPEVTSHTLTWLDRWFVGIVGRLPEVMTSQLSHGWSIGIVGPLASLAAWPPEVMTSHALAWLVRWHRWSVGIVGRLPEVMKSQLSHGWSVAMASLVRWHRWQAARGHDVTALAWLVRWHRWQLGWKIRSWRHMLSHGWCVGIVGRLPEVMTSHTLAWLVRVRWHRWQAARGHDVTHSRMVGPLASLAGCQRSWRHSSRMVGPWTLAEAFRCHDKQVQNAAHAHRWSLAHLHSKWSILSLYWPHTTFSVYLIEYCLAPPTDVLCIGSGSEAGYFPQWD